MKTKISDVRKISYEKGCLTRANDGVYDPKYFYEFFMKVGKGRSKAMIVFGSIFPMFSLKDISDYSSGKIKLIEKDKLFFKLKSMEKTTGLSEYILKIGLSYLSDLNLFEVNNVGNAYLVRLINFKDYEKTDEGGNYLLTPYAYESLCFDDESTDSVV